MSQRGECGEAMGRKQGQGERMQGTRGKGRGDGRGNRPAPALGASGASKASAVGISPRGVTTPPTSKHGAL